MSATFISSVEGNRQLLDGGAMFGNAPRVVWEKWIVSDNRGRIPLACRCLLLEFAGIKVLCETGIGAFFEPKLAERYGVQTPEKHLLLENLRQLGHTPESIDFVILSHLHFDHAGGLLPAFSAQKPDVDQEHKQEQTLVFSKAKFIVGQDAWSRALQPHARDQASYIPELTNKLAQSGRLLIYGRDPPPEPIYLTTN